jgi:TolB-like protein/Flp pilus assembly protein TadD
MGQFFRELQRRNVFRVAIAYLIVAWLVLQVGDTLAPALRLPEWVITVLAFFLILGFPIAVFFAWLFELTPEGLKKEKDVDRSQSITRVTSRKLDFVIIGVLAVALALFAVDKFVLAPDSDTAQEPVVSQDRRSIAVLPFVNMSSDPEQEYFSDGLSEEILNLLAKIPRLKVIGRTSSFAFKGRNEDLREIGNVLDVKTVLEGSVRKSGDRVRITAQLIDVSDGAHIWSETYDRTMTDIFALQDDVATAIIDALQIHVGAIPTRGRPTENAEAYALFLKARVAANEFEFQNAEKTLLQAIELDPDFAEAWEQLAYSYWWLAGTVVKAMDGQQLMIEAAAKALVLDPDLAFARALYQSGNIDSYSYLGEIEALERNVREQPSNPAPLDGLVYDLLEAGYLREALSMAERYVELDPLSPGANIRHSEGLFAVGRISEGQTALEVAASLGSELAIGNLAWWSLANGRDETAIAQYEDFFQQSGYPDSSWVRGLINGVRGSADGQAYLDRRVPEIVVSVREADRYNLERILRMWYLAFGFVDRYFEIILSLPLSDSTWTDADTLVYVGTVYRQFSITAHPKYLEVAESLGIVELWELRGPPDFCEKVGGEWVCN